MYPLIGTGLLLLLAGFAVLRYRRREANRRIAAFDRAHSVQLDAAAPPKVRVTHVGKGTVFVNVGGTTEFRPPDGFVSMERTIEEISKELSWLRRLGGILAGFGLLALVAGLLRLALAP